jgi:hypothetical protein
MGAYQAYITRSLVPVSRADELAPNQSLEPTAGRCEVVLEGNGDHGAHAALNCAVRMPRVTTGNTMTLCVIIGERAGEIPRVEHKFISTHRDNCARHLDRRRPNVAVPYVRQFQSQSFDVRFE